MKELTNIISGVADVSLIREKEYERFKALIKANLCSDGEPNGDQDGILCFNGFIFDGMKGWWFHHNLVAHVLTELYVEYPTLREAIIALIAVHAKNIPWAINLVFRALEDHDSHIRGEALQLIEMWDTPLVFMGLLQHLVKEEEDTFLIDQYKDLFGISRG